MMGVMQSRCHVTAATNKAHNRTLTTWFWRGSKKEEYANGDRSEWCELREDRTYDCGYDLLSGTPLVL